MSAEAAPPGPSDLRAASPRQALLTLPGPSRAQADAALAPPGDRPTEGGCAVGEGGAGWGPGGPVSPRRPPRSPGGAGSASEPGGLDSGLAPGRGPKSSCRRCPPASGGLSGLPCMVCSPASSWGTEAAAEGARHGWVSNFRNSDGSKESRHIERPCVISDVAEAGRTGDGRGPDAKTAWRHTTLPLAGKEL